MVYHVRFKLTPMPPTNRWRKIYKGKVYYVGKGHCQNKNDRAGYQVALAEWQAIRAKLDNTPTEEELQLYQQIQGEKNFKPAPEIVELLRTKRMRNTLSKLLG